MEALTKKTFKVEYEGKKYALAEDMTIADFLESLGLPKDMTVTLKTTKEGFVLDV